MIAFMSILQNRMRLLVLLQLYQFLRFVNNFIIQNEITCAAANYISLCVLRTILRSAK